MEPKYLGFARYSLAYKSSGHAWIWIDNCALCCKQNTICINILATTQKRDGMYINPWCLACRVKHGMHEETRKLLIEANLNAIELLEFE